MNNLELLLSHDASVTITSNMAFYIAIDVLREFEAIFKYAVDIPVSLSVYSSSASGLKIITQVR